MKHCYTLFLIIILSFQSSLLAQNALSFDGTDDFVTVPNASSFIASQNMSLSFWVYPTNASPGFPNFDGFAGFRNNTNADFYILHLSTTTVEARFRNSLGTNYDIVFAGLNPNAWNHFAMTYDGATLTLYHNGVSVGTQSASGNITSGTEVLFIGNMLFNSTNFYLNGQLDDVALWNKSLSSGEVMALYNACSVETTLNGLSLLYEFNQGVGNGNNGNITTVLDSKGNINGILNNFALTGTNSNFTPYSKNTFSTITATTCNGTYTTPSGMTLSTSGVYQDVLSGMSVGGCDSIITINLTVGSPSDTIIYPVECSSYTSSSGIVWTVSGTYLDTTTSVAGCDSIITINLTINDNIGFLTTQACGSYTSPSGNNTWTNSGTYVDVLTNSLGCDSLLSITLTINPLPDTSITQTGSSITANQANATYQWLDCANGNTPIPNETSATFTPTLNGEYAVEITMNNCIVVSNCYTFIQVGTYEVFNTPINAFPNPTTGRLQVDLGKSYQDISIQIIDVIGQVIQRQHFNQSRLLELSIDQPTGIYFLEITSNNQRTVLKVFVE